VLSDRWTVSEALRVVGALRAAVDGELGAVVLPRVGATWALHERVALGLAVGRSYRAPALDELYHPTTSGFAGNPRLLPEDAWEGELSLRLRPHALLRVALAGFARRVGAGIVYVNQNAFTVRPENVGAASVAGAELEAELGLDVGVLRLDVAAAASATASRLDVSGVALPTAPPLSLDLELRRLVAAGRAVALGVHARRGRLGHRRQPRGHRAGGRLRALGRGRDGGAGGLLHAGRRGRQLAGRPHAGERVQGPATRAHAPGDAARGGRMSARWWPLGLLICACTDVPILVAPEGPVPRAPGLSLECLTAAARPEGRRAGGPRRRRAGGRDAHRAVR
jgi:hypothetical protein